MQRGKQEPLEQKEKLVPRVIGVTMVTQEPKVILVTKANREREVNPELQAHRDKGVMQVETEILENLVIEVC